MLMGQTGISTCRREITTAVSNKDANATEMGGGGDRGCRRMSALAGVR